ncbi:MAG TPA: DUF1684 domain-containing protein [Chitinophagales bacterium]|nr:DUF1684 domain-containing protein [Chitinophagales bacterium]
MFRNGITSCFVLYLLLVMASCTAKQDPIEIGIQNYIDYVNIHRNEVKAFFNSEDSPLTPEARMTFKGVDYFPVDEHYRLIADFEPMHNGTVFVMPTTLGVEEKYRTVGYVYIQLNSISAKLEIYAMLNNSKKVEAGQYFMPFYDGTNGDETYAGGRYLDVYINEEGKAIVDFNFAYQPFCRYNAAFSCAIPPKSNTIPGRIRAGEKN